MIDDVERRFDQWLDKLIKNQDVRQAVKAHERKSLVVENTCEQIKMAEMSNIGKRFNVDKYNLLIGEVAKMFANAALEQKEQAAWSVARKNRHLTEQRKYEAAAEALQDLENEKEYSTPGGVIGRA